MIEWLNELFDYLSSTDSETKEKPIEASNSNQAPVKKFTKFPISIYTHKTYVNSNWMRFRSVIINLLNDMFCDENIAATLSNPEYAYMIPGVYRFKKAVGGEGLYSIYVKYYALEQRLLVIGFNDQKAFHLSKRIRELRPEFVAYLKSLFKEQVEVGKSVDITYDKFVERFKRNSVVDIPNAAMVGDPTFNKGGIDFNADKMNVQVQNNGGAIEFKLDPAMLQRLQNAPGFTPVIINIQPMGDIKSFLTS